MSANVHEERLCAGPISCCWVDHSPCRTGEDRDSCLPLQLHAIHQGWNFHQLLLCTPFPVFSSSKHFNVWTGLVPILNLLWRSLAQSYSSCWLLSLRMTSEWVSVSSSASYPRLFSRLLTIPKTLVSSKSETHTAHWKWTQSAVWHYYRRAVLPFLRLGLSMLAAVMQKTNIKTACKAVGQKDVFLAGSYYKVRSG